MVGISLLAVIIISRSIILIHHFRANSSNGGMILEILFPLCLLLRNNKLIKIDGKSIYYHNYIKAGILLTNQIQFFFEG